MRIAMVSEHASPLAAIGGEDAGGQNVHVAELARRLARRGHDVVVHTRRDDPDLPDAVEVEPGFVVDHVPAGPAAALPKDDLLEHMPAMGAALARRWRRDRPDVVHSHFWMSGLAALDGVRGLDVPVAHTFHALGSVKRRHQGDADTSPPERIALERRLCADVDRIVATCTDEVFELRRLGAVNRDVSIVPCGVDVARFAGAADGPATPATAPTVLVATRLVRRKGVEDAIAALALLPGVRLEVVGGPAGDAALDADPEARRLRALAAEHGVADRFVLRGALAREAMPQALRDADVVTCPAWYEPFGLVPLEAMAAGTPVVATAVGGHVDSVVHGVTGLHVPPHDAAALAEALGTMLDDADLRARLGAAGRRRVAERFDWDAVAGATLDVYDELRAPDAAAAGADGRLTATGRPDRRARPLSTPRSPR